MRHIDFDDLWKNHLFDYKDGDLLVIDDITRLNLSDYEERFFRPSEYIGLSPLYVAVSRIRRSSAQRICLCQYAEHHPEISLQVREERVWSLAP
jgi:hypothetical protein